jgi:hypothetical protein
MIFVNSYWFSKGCSDVDVIRFVNATGITNPTIIGAVCKLTTSLKNNGLWDKLQAIYPFVGGTAATHKFNLKNSLDTDAAFRLNFVGGWTHSANGALPNGTNAYANPFWNPNVQTSVLNACFGLYSRTNNTTGVQVYGCFSSTLTNRFFHNLSNGNIQMLQVTQITYTANPSTRLFISRREGATLNESYRDGVSLGTNATLYTASPNFNFLFGATNDFGTIRYYSVHQIAFAFLGGNSALTNTDAINLTNIVNTFQTTLGRNV